MPCLISLIFPILWGLCIAGCAAGMADGTRSPDRRLAPDSTVPTWHHFRGKRSAILGVFPAKSEHLDFDFVSVGKSGEVLGWRQHDQIPFLLYKLSQPVRACTFDKDRSLVALSTNTALSIVALAHGEREATADPLPSIMLQLEFDPQNPAILMAGADGKVYRWHWSQPNAGKRLNESSRDFERYLGHSSVVSAIAYHPLGRLFLSADWNGALNAWLTYDSDPHSGEFDKNILGGEFFSEQSIRRRAIRSDRSRVEYLVFSPRGDTFLVATSDGIIELWATRGLQRLTVVQTHASTIRDIAFAPSGVAFTSYSRDSELRIWNITQTYDPLLERDSYTIEQAGSLRLPLVTNIAYANDDSLIVGTENGDLLQIEVAKVLLGNKSPSPKVEAKND